jgi:hypothetical protein
MKRTIIGIAAGVALLAAIGAAKPSPPPTLGIPHVVTVYDSQAVNNHGEARCPTGEIALSAGWAQTNDGVNPSTNGIADLDVAFNPIVENGRPVGYAFNTDGFASVGFLWYVTCSPVVT